MGLGTDGVPAKSPEPCLQVRLQSLDRVAVRTQAVRLQQRDVVLVKRDDFFILLRVWIFHRLSHPSLAHCWFCFSRVVPCRACAEVRGGVGNKEERGGREGEGVRKMRGSTRERGEMGRRGGDGRVEGGAGRSSVSDQETMSPFEQSSCSLVGEGGE